MFVSGLSRGKIAWNRPSIDIGPRSNIGVDTGSETARNRACREPTENEMDSQSGACLPPRTTALGNHLPNCLRFAALGLGYVSRSSGTRGRAETFSDSSTYFTNSKSPGFKFCRTTTHPVRKVAGERSCLCITIEPKDLRPIGIATPSLTNQSRCRSLCAPPCCRKA